ncbi:cysteine--tRNA ligase [candidate division KSB1 bacterium]|nr:cysteine--tRNA ligase [candidate division KSB1 bacterium]
MAIRIYNTLTRRVEEFVPREPGKVGMYTCGPTVYNRAHIGNFRTFMFSDLVRRYLRYRGYEVTWVMNFTDIDDRTITGSQKEGIPMREFTERYTKIFHEDRETLGIERADIYPKATEHIPEMVRIVEQLKAKGLAYQTDGSWYFKVTAFPDYGKLARLDVEGLQQGERVAGDEYAKHDPRDFALWKGWEPVDGDVFWETAVGKGRPGWHLECSAMSLKYLGEEFDIHLGGVDLIFPHHQNEVAQTEGCTGKRLARYWMHSEFLMIEADKMSKSLGNVYSISDVVEQGYVPREIRFALMGTHYRQQLNFTVDGLLTARNSLERIDAFLRNLEFATGGGGIDEVTAVLDRCEKQFQDGLDDDFNYAEASAAIFNLVRDVNSLIASGKVGELEAEAVHKVMRRINSVVDWVYPKQVESGDAEIDALVLARDEARRSKDWKEADRIRDELAAREIILEDRGGRTVWRRKG